MSAVLIAQSNEPKDAEIKVRVSKSVKTTIQRAAELSGLTLTDFIITELYERTKNVLEEKGVIVLENAAKAAFVEALIDPPALPSPLEEATAIYKAQPAE